MNYEIITTEEFLRDAKSILKVYPGLKHDIQSIILKLQGNPEQGTPLGHGLYKLRISITGKSSGKSYGARIIHLVITLHHKVFLLKVYDKSEKKDLSIAETKTLVLKAKSIQQFLTQSSENK